MSDGRLREGRRDSDFQCKQVPQFSFRPVVVRKYLRVLAILLENWRRFSSGFSSGIVVYPNFVTDINHLRKQRQRTVIAFPDLALRHVMPASGDASSNPCDVDVLVTGQDVDALHLVAALFCLLQQQ